MTAQSSLLNGAGLVFDFGFGTIASGLPVFLTQNSSLEDYWIQVGDLITQAAESIGEQQEPQ